MKSLMSLWSRLAAEAASQCYTSATRDINTVSSRFEHEGLSFLTITLPDLGKATQKWLDQGKADIHPSFSSERGGSLPRLFGGFFCRVFDRKSGVLLEDPCVASIQALRQLTLMFGKIELECSPARQRKAIQNYLKCELEVQEFDRKVTDGDLYNFSRMSNMLFGPLFTLIDRDIYYGKVVPKHGPGSTADGLAGNGKYRQAVWTDRLEPIFSAGDHLFTNWRNADRYWDVDFNEPGSEVPVRVTLVPKTLKTPRVIAMEPTCMQYMQQAVLRCFLEHFYRDRLLSKFIGFDDQVPNQDLARQGSLDQRTATLDLSDASDRVSNQLVRAMFHQWPHLGEAVDATRSRRAVLPGDPNPVRLSKYASMGSALCFPVEAMVFTTLIFLGIEESLRTSLSRRSLLDFVGSVRVFGDDLIVPVDHVSTVIRTLEHFGARVGADKSFWTGKFRESCGREFFNGHDVSITRVRQAFPTSRQSVTEVESIVSLRNQLFMSGFWQTTRWLDGLIREKLTFFPDVLPTSSVLGRVSSLGYRSERVHPSLHSPLVKGYVVKAKPPKDLLVGTDALLKCLLKLDTDAWLRSKVSWRPSGSILDDDQSSKYNLWRETLFPKSYELHLERTGRPKSADIKLGWRSPF